MWRHNLLFHGRVRKSGKRRVPCEDKNTVLADLSGDVDYLISVARSDRMAQWSIYWDNRVLRYCNIPDVTG